MARQRVLIYGSCVSRDTFEHMNPTEYELIRYVARQSVLSAISPAVTQLRPPSLSSAFQQRMVDGDFQSNLLQLVEGSDQPPDLVLVDLVDERLGVHLFPDGSVVTRTPELIASGVAGSMPPDVRHVTFGSAEHRALWSPAIRSFGERLRKVVGPVRIVVLDIPWASRSVDGEPPPTSFGLTARDVNSVMSEYVDSAVHALGAEVVKLAPDEVLSNPQHPWGPAPFHYAERVYVDIVSRLTNRPGSARE